MRSIATAVVLFVVGIICLQPASPQRFPMKWDGGAQSCSAMAFDAVASGTVSNGTSLSWTHTPVGIPTAVAVGFQVFGAANATSTTVTYGGTSMAQATVTTLDGNSSFEEMFGLANPPSSAQTVVITDTNTGLFINAGSVTVTCSNKSTTFDSANPAVGTNASPTVAVTSVSGEIVVDVLGGNSTGSPYSATGSGQVQKWGPLSAGGDRGMGSISTATGASTTMSWSAGGGAAPWGIAAASFKHQ